MLKKITLWVFVSFLIFSFTGDHTYIITPGSGTDKLIVGKTKIKEVFALLGKNDKFTEGIIDGKDFSIHMNRYIYTKLGVTIISHVYEPKGEDLDNAVIYTMIFENPSHARTVDNLVLGTSTKENITEKYGQPDIVKFSDANILHYRKKGISFELDRQTKNLSAIVVYKPNDDLNKQ